MASGPRIVAELGRPETPDETAARKAESSRVYRSSQTARNLVAALLITLAVVAVIVFAVPRGTPAPPPRIDVAAVAASVGAGMQRTAITPHVPPEWIVNRAAVEGNGTAAWTIVYVPDAQSGFLRVAQGFDADPAWPTRVLGGAAVDGTVAVAGIVWQTYRISDPARAGNVSAAMSTQAGPDTILIYGSTADAAMQTAAAGVADQVRALRTQTKGATP